MAGNFKSISNNDAQNYSVCRLQLVVKRLDTEQNQNSIIKQSCEANEYKKVIIKLWGQPNVYSLPD